MTIIHNKRVSTSVLASWLMLSTAVIEYITYDCSIYLCLCSI